MIIHRGAWQNAPLDVVGHVAGLAMWLQGAFSDVRMHWDNIVFQRCASEVPVDGVSELRIPSAIVVCYLASCSEVYSVPEAEVL